MVEWSIFNEIFAVAFNVLYFVIIIGTIFIVILDNRNPVKTMAWVLVLFFLPIVGLVFYFFFGRSTRKEKLISKKRVHPSYKTSYGRIPSAKGV